MRKSAFLLVVAACVSVSSNSDASIVTGSFTFGGTTTPTDQIGPWNMTASTTGSTFAVLRFVVDQVFTFADITNINYDYDSNAGGIGGGTPRVVIVFDDASSIILHWGPAGSFVDPTIGNGLNTGNLAALTDVGRYDLGGAGGSAYTDRAAALGLVGTRIVDRFSLIVDTFNSDRDFDISAVNVEIADTGAVPEPGSVLVWSVLAMIAAGVGMCRQKLSA